MKVTPDPLPVSAAGLPPGEPGNRLGPALLLVLAVTALLAGAGYFWHRESAASGRDVHIGAKRLTLHASSKAVPELRFTDGNGMPLSLDDAQGKVVLLNIWATWCGPCREEMPALDRLQATLGGRDFEVIAVSIDTGDEGLAAVKRFYAEVWVRNLRVYHDTSATAGFQVGAVGVPTTLLLDREGRELGRMSGAAEWDSAAAVALIEGLQGGRGKASPGRP